ncbi:DUF4384 domain-containing protein [bacterium]|nr:DUF4384 domain-containing protein [bacterium]
MMRQREWMIALAIVTVLVFASAASAATVAREEAVPQDGKSPAEPVPVSEVEQTGRIVVDPEPNWGDWDDIDDSFYHYHPGGLRIDTWVDRGEWATYEPGERLWVYFRVNRPCYVTIFDYTTDGRVEVLYPNAWSGSSVVHPGRVYRVPDDGRFSLRIAGPGGIETLVACAHELSWPGGSHSHWRPSYHSWMSPRGRVVEGGSSHGRVMEGGSSHGRVVEGGSSHGRVVEGRSPQHPLPHRPRGYPSGWRFPPNGRVVVESNWWPVPSGWRDAPERWACDSVTFRVAAGGYGHGSNWGGDSWGGSGDWDDDWWDDSDDWDDDDYYGHDEGWNWHGDGRRLMRKRFRMSKPSDEFHETLRFGGEKVHVTIDCTGSRRNDPTEIIGRIVRDGGWGSDVVFRIDADGRHGDVPRRGEVYTAFSGPVRVDVKIADFKLAKARPWQLPRIEWITFEVRVYGR